MSGLEVWTERYKSGCFENIDVLYVNGKSESSDFLEGLYGDDQDAWDKFDYVFERKCEGHRITKKMFHRIEGVKGAYEFKAKGRKTWRIFIVSGKAIVGF